MPLVYLMDPGYGYVGETIQLLQAISESQLRAIEQILGERPARLNVGAELCSFHPVTGRQADALRTYLRREQIVHATMRLDPWSPDSPENGAQEVGKVARLAGVAAKARGCLDKSRSRR